MIQPPVGVICLRGSLIKGFVNTFDTVPHNSPPQGAISISRLPLSVIQRPCTSCGSAVEVALKNSATNTPQAAVSAAMVTRTRAKTRYMTGSIGSLGLG